MYYVVPKVILFRLEHTRRTLVPKVDFISAPGTSPENVYRPGGPIALVTNRCLFAFDRERRRFRLASVHPGHTVAEVIEHTGFDFDRPADVPVTAGALPRDAARAAHRRSRPSWPRSIRSSPRRCSGSANRLKRARCRPRISGDPVFTGHAGCAACHIG